jgi:nucleoside-diphosphate kinase
MAIERTFSMIKPDATERNLTGEICAELEKSGLKIIASRRTRMTPEKAAQFYSVHS